MNAVGNSIFFKILAVLAGLAGAAGASADSLLIENVTVIDGTGRPSVPGSSVLVEGQRISRVKRFPRTEQAVYAHCIAISIQA
jgi:hypothetical protein